MWEDACRRCMNQENVVRGCDYFSEEHKCLSPIRGHYPRFKNWELFRRAVLMRALTRIAVIPVPSPLPLAQQCAITMRNIALEALECVNRIKRIKRAKTRKPAKGAFSCRNAENAENRLLSQKAEICAKNTKTCPRRVLDFGVKKQPKNAQKQPKTGSKTAEIGENIGVERKPAFSAKTAPKHENLQRARFGAETAKSPKTANIRQNTKTTSKPRKPAEGAF